jgi:hypothetical protein
MIVLIFYEPTAQNATLVVSFKFQLASGRGDKVPPKILHCIVLTNRNQLNQTTKLAEKRHFRPFLLGLNNRAWTDWLLASFLLVTTSRASQLEAGDVLGTEFHTARKHFPHLLTHRWQAYATQSDVDKNTVLVVASHLQCY